ARPSGPVDGHDGRRHAGEITRGGTHIKRSGVERREEDQPHDSDGGDGPGEPGTRSAIRFGEFLFVVTRSRRGGNGEGALREEHRRGDPRPPPLAVQSERSRDRPRKYPPRLATLR